MNDIAAILETLGKYEKLGSRTLKNGTKLIGNTPHVGKEAYLHAIYPGLNSVDLLELEGEIGIALTPELKGLFSTCNGMDLFSGSLSIFGLRRDYKRSGDSAWQPFSMTTPNIDERIADAARNFIFFGAYDWDGSALYVSANSNTVVTRCSAESTVPLNHWPNIATFLSAEIERLGQLYTTDGRYPDDETVTTP